MELTPGTEIQELQGIFGLTKEFSEKLLRIEHLTMTAKDPKIDARYECIPEEKIDGYNVTIAFELRTLLNSLSTEENKIIESYLKQDYWYPSKWSAGNY